MLNAIWGCIAAAGVGLAVIWRLWSAGYRAAERDRAAEDAESLENALERKRKRKAAVSGFSPKQRIAAMTGRNPRKEGKRK